MKNIPKYRFKEFEGEWKKEKLGNVVEFYKGKGISKSQVSDIGRPCILYGELYTKYNEIISEVESKTNIDMNFTLSKSNDVLIPSSGETAIDISRASAILLDNVALGGDLNVLRPNKEVDGRFLSYILNSAKKKDIARIAQGVSVVHLYAKQLKGLNINIPPLLEQEKIVESLSSIDARIKNQEDKIGNLEDTKKGLMQKIFSQEVRFKDENGEKYPGWEEKELGEVGAFYNGLRGKTKDDFNNGSSKYISYMNIFSNTLMNFEITDTVNVAESENQNKVKYGDILFTQSSETPEEVGMTSVWIRTEEPYLNSFSFGFRFNDLINIEPIYIGYLLRTESIRNKIILEGQGSTRYNLSSKRIEKLKFPYPCLSEQKKIADALSTMDEKIEIEKEILETLKEIKRGLLQQMFV